MTSVIDLNLESWQFLPEKQGRAWLRGEGSETSSVRLPHCWNEQDTFLDGLRYRQGWGSYRTVVELEPTVAARWFLDVGGFFGSARLWVNGRDCGTHEGRHLGFRIEIGPCLRPGKNVLALLVENRHRRGRLPGRPDPDFLLYGGLAGGVRLLGRGAVCFERHGLRLETSVEEDGRVSMQSSARFEGPIQGEFEDEVRVVVDAGGGSASTHESLAMERRASRWRSLSFPELPKIELWSPEQPSLYPVTVRLEDGDGRVLDSVERRVGFRRAKFSADGFELNGERYSLHGMNRHQSLPGFGSALPEDLERFDVEQIKAFGGNCVRLSHYPQSESFLEACDELGLLVYSELCSWKTVATGSWLREAKRQFAQMIERDRHRPSVVVWGMGNESRCRKAYLALGEVARRLDPARPVCYAENHLYRARRQNTINLVDVWGLNYELEVLDELSGCSRSGAVLVTECMNPCLHDSSDSLAETQLSVIEHELGLLEGRREVAGYFVWCYADYATLHRDRYRRRAGLFEASRLPKAGAWLFRARNSQGGQPFVRLFADWRRQGPLSRKVQIISNCAEIELRTGDATSVSRLIELENGRAEVEVDFSGKTLSAGEAGQVEVLACIAPWGEAQKVSLAVVRQWPGLRLVRVEVLDQSGARVRDHDGSVDLRVGPPYRVRSGGDRSTVPLSGGVAWVWLSSDSSGEGSSEQGTSAEHSEVIAEIAGLDAGRLELIEAKVEASQGKSLESCGS